MVRSVLWAVTIPIGSIRKMSFQELVDEFLKKDDPPEDFYGTDDYQHWQDEVWLEEDLKYQAWKINVKNPLSSFLLVCLYLKRCLLKILREHVLIFRTVIRLECVSRNAYTFRGSLLSFPGDEVAVSMEADSSVLAPMPVPTFVNMKVRHDWFFVPLSMMYTKGALWIYLLGVGASIRVIVLVFQLAFVYCNFCS